MSATRLRELVREARGGFAPDHVGKTFRFCTPALLDEEAGEMAPMLEDLVRSSRERLDQAGLEPLHREGASAQKLAKRERDLLVNLGALYAYLSAALLSTGRPAEALEAAQDGIAWCRAAEGHRQQAILCLMVAAVHQGEGELADEERYTRRALECARASHDPEAIVEMLDHLCSLLIVRQRLDEAETASEESIEIMRSELKDRRGTIYAALLMNKARIMMYRTHYAESIRTLREALRWADADLVPRERAAIMAHLGSVYLRLEHFQQSVECQHEVVRLGDRLGANDIRGWGYFRLAEAHLRLDEVAKAEETLDRADECTTQRNPTLKLAIAAKRSYIHALREEFERAIELCEWMLTEIGDRPYPDLEMYAHKALADIEMRRERYADAAEHFQHAIEVSDREFPPRTPALKIFLADALHRLGRDEEVIALLDEATQSEALNQSEMMTAFRLRGGVAEKRGDLRGALDCQRQAFAIERSLLERRAADSLRNARIVAETDLLEREADVERERRRRLEHELAEAIVELSDRKRMADAVEQRIRRALERAGTGQERASVTVLRETLTDIRAGAHAQESPLRYLSGVDEDFYRRLRSRCPDLTSKQERLCGLIRAGLASKEVASLMGLEAEGLKAQRKRLRKKLGLSPEDRLEAVLTAM